MGSVLETAPDEGDPIFDAAYSYLAPQLPQPLAREFAVRIAALARENLARKVRVEFTMQGPRLWIGGVKVRSWNGSIHAEEAQKVADAVQKELGLG